MPNTRDGRGERAGDAENRHRESEPEGVSDRTDEAEPPPDGRGNADETNSEEGPAESPRECHRRGCDKRAAFAVLERYQEETGQGAVEAEALLCRPHTAEESPANLDGVYADYVFRVEPLPEMETPDE